MATQQRLPAYLLAGLGAVAALAGLALVTAQDTWGLPAAREVPTDATVGLSLSVVAAAVLSSGSLARGSRVLAWVLLVAGVCSGLTTLVTAVALGATGPSPVVSTAVQLEGFLWVPGFVPLLTLVPLLYPDGLLPGWVWRATAALAVVGTALMTVGVGLYPEPFSGRADLDKPVTALAVSELLVPAAAAVLVPTAVICLAALLLRLVRARGLARRQVAVLLGAAAVLAVVTTLQGVLPTPADVLLQAGAAGLVAVAIGVAVTRHGLYDLDTAIARALVAASLGICLAGAYLTLFSVLESLPSHRSAFSAAVAAGITGLVVQPLAARLTAAVDRMFYGDRADPLAVTSELASRLAATGLDVDRVPQVVCDTIVGSLRLGGAALRVRGATGAASAGSCTGDATAYPLTHRGEPVGELDVWPRSGERSLDVRDDRAVRGVADLAAPAVATLHLHRRLQRSREQLVAAREAERRQLRRDLHDGLGATLAGLRLQVETAYDLTTDEDVRRLLGSATSGVGQAVAEVRAVSEGLRPAGVDDLGLARAVIALAERVRTPDLAVSVDVDPAPAADPAVEAAVHRIASEALANVVRHAGAGRVTVSLRDDDRLVLEVRDDGRGLGARSPGGSGLGLDSMRQRAEEVGGDLEVRSSSHGTVVRAVLPHTVGELR